MQMKYFRRGIPISASDALDERGALKDGVTMTVPATLMDSVQRAVSGTVVVTDGAGTTSGLHRPGYRVIADAGDERAAAYALYDAQLQNAWRGTDSRKKRVKRDPQGRIVSEEEEFEDAVPPLRDGMTLDELQRDHEQRMARAYQVYDHWIEDQWRNR